MNRRNQRNFKNARRKLVIKDKKAFIRSVSILVIIIALCIAIYASRKIITAHFASLVSSSDVTTEADDNTQNDESKNTPQEDATFTIASTGDIMCHNTQYQDAQKPDGTYDFSYVFDDVKYYIQTADLAIGNLETTFAGSEAGYSSYPTFNSPEALAYNLKNIGFDVLTTANNHSLDKGYKGIESTIHYLDDADIAHTGTFTSPESQNTILYKYVKGVKIAFLSYTYGTNGISVPSGKDYCINLINKDLISQQLATAKEGNPDLICVSMHWGQEYRTEPTQEQKDLADFLFQNGVDVILGNHSHVLEPMEKREVTQSDGTQKDCFVSYSLGNFMSGQVKELTKDTAILNLTITKHVNTGKITIDNVSYTPLYMYKSNAKTHAFKLLDINKSIEAYNAGASGAVDASTYKTLTTELDKIKKILGN